MRTGDAVSYGVAGKAEEGFIVKTDALFTLGTKIENVSIAAFPMHYLDDNAIDGLLGWDIIRNFHLEMTGPEGILNIY